jgi:hypothetical protein
VSSWRHDLLEVRLAEAYTVARQKFSDIPHGVISAISKGFIAADTGDPDVAERWAMLAEERILAEAIMRRAAPVGRKRSAVEVQA